VKIKKLPLNEIILGDCLEVMKTFPDKSVDLVLTDPPYGINVGGVKAKSSLESQQFHSEKVKVGIRGKSIPKVIGDLMTGKSPKKHTLMKSDELVKIR
jgi:DNA modification methylase